LTKNPGANPVAKELLETSERVQRRIGFRSARRFGSASDRHGVGRPGPWPKIGGRSLPEAAEADRLVELIRSH